MSRWVEWIEPFGPNSEPVYMAVPEATAIAVMKDIANRHYPPSFYRTDEDALQDFVVVNWAEIKERT